MTKKKPKHEPFDFGTARLATQGMFPYLYQHVCCLSPIRAPGLGTMGVDDHMRVMYDPALLEEGIWSLAETATVIMHEDLHVIFRHHARRVAHCGFEIDAEMQARWNMAADFCVNQELVTNPLCQLPKGCLFPKDYGLPDNEIVERYYDMLEGKVPEDMIKYFQWLRGEGQFGEGQGVPEDAPGPCAGGGGSGADGVLRPWEDKRPGEPGAKHPGMSEFERKILERKTAEEIRRHCKSRGTVGSYLSRWCEEILEPKVDPFTAITRVVRWAAQHRNGLGDYTYRKMPRRHLPGGLRAPATHQPIPRHILAVDTSGSMDEKDLAYGLGCVKLGLRNAPRGSLKVMAGDTDAKSVQTVFNVNQVDLLGGGGTDMRVLIEAAEKERPAPDAIIVVTDGFTPWPDSKGLCPVVAVVTRAESVAGVPSWIRTICTEGVSAPAA